MRQYALGSQSRSKRYNTTDWPEEDGGSTCDRIATLGRRRETGMAPPLLLSGPLLEFPILPARLFRARLARGRKLQNLRRHTSRVCRLDVLAISGTRRLLYLLTLSAADPHPIARTLSSPRLPLQGLQAKPGARICGHTFTRKQTQLVFFEYLHYKYSDVSSWPVLRGSIVKTVLLAGGLGTRLAEETEVAPSPWSRSAVGRFFGTS